MEIYRAMKRPSFDGDQVLQASPRREVDRASPWPSDRDPAAFILMKIGSFSWRHVSKSEPFIVFT